MANAWQEYSNKVLGEKYNYDKAKEQGNQQGMDNARNTAKTYYDFLEKNGYSDISKNLSNMGANDAKKYLDKLQKEMGNVKVRDYLKTRLAPYGIDADTVDAKIDFNDATKEVFFNGKNLGRFNISENNAWASEEQLKPFLDDFISENNLTLSKEQLTDKGNQRVDDEMANYFKMVDTEYGKDDDYMKGWADKMWNTDLNDNMSKSIMDQFNYMGGLAAGDAIADGAGSNGGNIDSFASANALRQQKAFTEAGVQAALEGYNSRVAAVQDILNRLSGNTANVESKLAAQLAGVTTQKDINQQYFDNGQKEKLDDAEIRGKDAETDAINANTYIDTNKFIATTTGDVPYSVLLSQNPYFDQYGQLKNPNLDYQAIYEQKLAEGDTKGAVLAAIARGEKVQIPGYEKYATEGVIMSPEQKETLAKYIQKGEWENALNLAQMGYNSAEKTNAADNDAAIKRAKIAAGTEKYKSDNESEGSKYSTDKQYDATIAEYQNNLDVIDASKTTTTDTPGYLEANKVDSFLGSLNGTEDEDIIVKRTSSGRWKVLDKGKIPDIIVEVYSNDHYTNDEKHFILTSGLGISEDEITETIDSFGGAIPKFKNYVKQGLSGLTDAFKG